MENILQAAKEAGFTDIELALFLHNERGEILLLEESGGRYVLPNAEIQGEDISHAIERIAEKHLLSVKKVDGFLSHQDSGKKENALFCLPKWGEF